MKWFNVARVLDSLGELYKILDHELFLTEAVIEMFLENICTFYERQIILLNSYLKEFLSSKCSSCPSNPNQIKIKSTQIYDKW